MCALPQQDVLDEIGPDPVVRVEVRADEETGDDNDCGAAHDLLLCRPLDLLQLGDRLLDEAKAGEPARAFCLALGARRLDRGDLRLFVGGTLARRWAERRRAGRDAAALPTLLAGRASHGDYRV